MSGSKDMTSSDPGADAEVVRRLRALAVAEADKTSPWPGVDEAVRRRRRTRAVAVLTVTVLGGVIFLLATPPAVRTTLLAAVPGLDAPADAIDGTVASYFSPPQAYPGPVWSRFGRPVPNGELNSIAGPEHCEWQSAVLLQLSWPLGSLARDAGDLRQFIRDPEGAILPELRAGLRETDLPADAEDTGYRLDGLQLWLSPGDPDAAYLRSTIDVERWPSPTDTVACA